MLLAIFMEMVLLIKSIHGQKLHLHRRIKSMCRGISYRFVTSVNRQDGRGYIRAYTRNDGLFLNRDKAVFPHDVYSCDRDFQESFVAGLFDADGNYFEAQNRVRLASKHYEFLVGVRRLLEQLGILSGISTAGISTYGNSQGYMLTVQTAYVTRFLISSLPADYK